MAVRIRMKRMGSRHRPFFRLVVADSRFQRDGRFLEELGFYDPLTEPARINVKEAATVKWLQSGAGISDTARSVLKRVGVMKRYDELKRGVISEAELLEVVEIGGTSEIAARKAPVATDDGVAIPESPAPAAQAPVSAAEPAEAPAATVNAESVDAEPADAAAVDAESE